MKTRWLGLATMAVGLTMSVAGAAGLVLSGSGDSAPTAAGTTSPAAATSTSATVAETTTTTESTTTTEAMSTTSEPSTTTTTVAVDDLVESFVVEFTGWIAAGDSDTLVARLHPVVIDEYGADLCAGFVEREILELEDYRLSGPVTGPTPSRYGTVEVDLYEAPATFTFQGSEFTANAGFALVDGVVHWFATCR